MTRFLFYTKVQIFKPFPEFFSRQLSLESIRKITYILIVLKRLPYSPTKKILLIFFPLLILFLVFFAGFFLYKSGILSFDFLPFWKTSDFNEVLPSPFSTKVGTQETKDSSPTNPYDICATEVNDSKPEIDDGEKLFEIVDETTIKNSLGEVIFGLAKLHEGQSYEIPPNASSISYYSLDDGRALVSLQGIVTDVNGSSFVMDYHGYIFSITLSDKTSFWISDGFKTDGVVTQPISSDFLEVASALSPGDYITVAGYVDSKEDYAFEATIFYLMQRGGL